MASGGSPATIVVVLLRRRFLLVAVALLVVGVTAAFLVGSDQPAAEPAVPAAATDTTAAPTTTASTEPPTTTTTEPPSPWAELATDEVRAVVTPTGVVVPVTGPTDDGRWHGTSPCFEPVVVDGAPLHGAHVVLDPGHGGSEPGAVGPTGLTEKEANMAVAEETKRRLEEAGATVVLTRTADYRITIQSRTEIATRLQPELFISIHHNAEPDGPSEGPGAETYFQIASPESRRAAGLLWEELVGAFGEFEADWVADTDAGAKYRPDAEGGDYYGILRRSAGVPAVLSEAAFISNPTEEALLRDPAFVAAQADAISRAALRYVSTDDPGSGFVEPYPRDMPAGGGGGVSGCQDPPLG